MCATASAEPLGDAEVRLGYGVALAERGEMTTRRATPLTVAAIAGVRTSYEPPLSAYGGLIAETLDRTSVGGLAGVRLEGERFRASAGGVAIVAPRTLYGPMVTGGACTRAASSLRLCGDLQLTAYLGGTDLVDGHVVTHVQLAIAMVIDAF